MNSSKLLGIVMLLIYVCVVTALLNDAFIMPYNLQNLLRYSSMYAIIGIGAVLVIVTGGIDLSTGSLIGLVGCTMTLTLKSWSEHTPADNGAYVLWLFGAELLVVAVGWYLFDKFIKKRAYLAHSKRIKIGLVVAGVGLLIFSYALPSILEQGNGAGVLAENAETAASNETEATAADTQRPASIVQWVTIASAVSVALLLSVHLGLLHGLLITKLQLQPFVVTLCGLMCYRGLSRYITSDQSQSVGEQYNSSLTLLAEGKPCTATAVMLFLGIALLLVGIYKIVRRNPLAVQQRNYSGWLFALIGAVVTFVASSRYWNGLHITLEDPIASFGRWNLCLVSLDLPAEAIDRPAVLMAFAIWPMLFCFLALIALAVAQAVRTGHTAPLNLLRRFAPLALLGVAIVTLFLAKGWVGDRTVTLADMNYSFQSSVQQETDDGSGIFRGSRTDDVFLTGVNIVLWKMGSVFASMALLMASILWLVKAWTRDGNELIRALLILTSFFSVLWLLSKTSIHETDVQTPFFFVVVIGAIAALFLNATVYGRYLLALGNNEEAAKFSGINTDKMKVIAYVLCAMCGGVAGILYTLDSASVEPSGFGTFLELYAIAAAVLGGCSLRGGEGSILGVIIGATIMRVLYNAPDMIGIASQLELFTIGSVLLIGVIVDETARRVAANRDRKVVS